ncbi:MAG TPA: hypothetical protein VN688_21540 [Gemmataceae bacterium]|nr:hypothetical protein [Gemmataceae bacterium]
MAGEWISERFPQFEAAIRRLTEQHRELEDEPLHLALAYLPRRDGREVDRGIFLFEVIGGVADRFGQSEDLFEAAFDAIPGLPTGFDQTLHLILTTSREFEEALTHGRPLAMEVADAVRHGDYKVLHHDRVGQKVLRQIRAAVQPRKRAARG